MQTNDDHAGAGPTRSTSPIPPPRGPTGPRLGEQPGDWIGPYKLLELIGEGGFGTVWLAEQAEPVRRRVALKVIKPGMDSKAVIARFEAERQALAMMSHPNVAKVLDAGATAHGLPYFVMEHVKGAPITEYCDVHRLTIEERLALFATVCDAVQHAHMKGIIHRDLKPGNILVTIAESGQDGARPVVIDFGVAKALAGRLSEQTIYTERGQLIGTPEYMSPEQAEMSETDIDTRSDVYSLGVVLYELLTGAVPFDTKTLRAAGNAAIQKVIREQDPPHPSTRLSTMGESSAAVATARQTGLDALESRLRRELEWIPLKALRKDRAERYRSASELADDVGNYLAHRPLIAGPERAGYKVRKFVRRNKGSAMAAAVIAGSLLVATVVSVWFGLGELAARKRESDQRQRAVRQQGIAEAISTFVTKALQSSDPFAGGKQDTTIIEAMRNAVREIESGAFNGDLETEAALRGTIGTILVNNAQYSEAQPLLEQALAIRERLHGSDDPLVAASVSALGTLYFRKSHFVQAELLFKRALAIRENSLGPDHLDVAASLNNLAGVHRSQGQFSRAEPLLLRSLAIRERALGPDHLGVAASVSNVAELLYAQSQYDRAEPLYARALAIREMALDPDSVDVASSLSNLGLLHFAKLQYDRAEPLLKRSMGIWERAVGPEHPALAKSLKNLGLVYHAQGRYTEAEPLFARSLAIYEAAFDAEHREVAAGLSSLGLTIQAQGRLIEAEPLLKRSLAIREKIFPPDHTDVAVSLEDLATLYRKMDRLQDAEPLAERAHRIRSAPR